MLEQITLEDFQVHENRTIDLDPKLTMIAGDTDQGKSSIIRALRWICLNKPRGDQFSRHDGEGAEVELIVDGEEVLRSMRDGNRYVLNDEEFRSFRSDVPDPVANLLNVSEINFGCQHDPSFWFHLSPGQLAKELNSIIDLSVIDDALSFTAKTKREAQTRKTVAEERVEDLEKEIRDGEWIEDCAEEFQRIKHLDDQIVRMEDEISILTQRISIGENIRDRIKVLTQTTRGVSELISEGRSLLGLIEQEEDLTKRVEMIDRKRRLLDEKRREKDLVDERLHQLGKEEPCPLCGRRSDPSPS